MGIYCSCTVFQLHGMLSNTAACDCLAEISGINAPSLSVSQTKEKAGRKRRENDNRGSGKDQVLTCPPEKEEAVMDFRIDLKQITALGEILNPFFLCGR